jgi:glucuronoarabinoxylan endo-1,4-beta-xylanase
MAEGFLEHSVEDSSDRFSARNSQNRIETGISHESHLPRFCLALSATRKLSRSRPVVRFRAICSTASAFLLAAAMASAQTATINYAATEQTIRGFGGSTGFQPALTSAEAETIFGTGSGQLGLSLLRVRIDDSSTTGGSNWAQSLSDGQLASAQGATVFASPWSPPAAWKSNGSTIMGSLLPADYAAYANYLNLFTAYMKAGGVDLYAISMQNEPDANVTYDSCVWTAAQMDTWIAGNASVLTTKLIMPESESFTTSYSDPALDDSSAVNYISIVGGHLYGASPFYYTNAENKGKDVWMTEHYLNPSTGAEPDMADAITMAEEIHNSMTVGEYNAYVWWWIEDEPSESSYIGMVDVNDNVTFYGLALGQFAKYIRPGYAMVSATNTPSSGVYVSAYKGDGNYVIVAINSNSSATSLPVAITGATVTSFTPYQTTATESMAELSAIGVSGDAFTYSLPAQSITTFVGTASTTPGISLSPSASNLSIAPGASGTDTITVTDLNGFSGSVTLAISGLPSGVTAKIGTNPTAGTSVLTFTASTAASYGTSTITVTGTSGSVTATTTILLTVPSPCTQTAITPYIQVNEGAWQQVTAVTVASGNAVNIGPQPIGGTWAWTGPGGFTSTSREIDGIPLTTGVDTFVATYTNSSGCPTTQAFTITVTGGTSGSFTLAPSAATLSVAQGSSATDTITVTDVSGFTGSVTLAASGLPSGVTAAFGTNPTAGSSVVTFTASSTATAGSSTVTITGTSGSLTASSTIALTVVAKPPPSFTLAPSAATLSVAQGSSATDTITVTDVSGFTGSVTLAASGLPSGVTAGFGTNPTSGSSVVTFTASSTATAGSSTVTITGTSSSLTASTTIALTVTGSGACTPTVIVPYISVSGTWAQETSATVTSTTTVVDLGPQPVSGGTWAWTGPNGFTSTARQINSIALSAGANVYTATYTNTSSCKSTQAFTITVSSTGTPGFTLAPSAASLSLTQGKTATDTITVTDVNGFTGAVTFAASGLPSGVTAAFSGGTLTLTASATATVGSSTITITGTSGSTSATTTIALTVSSSGTTGGGCTIDYTISPQNSTSFGAAITIVNNGSTALSSWTLTWSFANGQTVTSLWNGNETQSGANVTVTNESYNGSIAAGGSYTGVGFNGTWNGTTNAIPTAFTLNGTACTVN